MALNAATLQVLRSLTLGHKIYTATCKCGYKEWFNQPRSAFLPPGAKPQKQSQASHRGIGGYKSQDNVIIAPAPFHTAPSWPAASVCCIEHFMRGAHTPGAGESSTSSTMPGPRTRLHTV
jgi:hypothetical protein